MVLKKRSGRRFYKRLRFLNIVKKREEHMNTVNVRKVEIGKGIPKICVPVVGITRDDIIDAACKAKETADLVEWRADWYEDVLDFKKTEKMMEELRETLETFRSFSHFAH